MSRPYVRRQPHEPVHQPVHAPAHAPVHTSPFDDLEIEQAPAGKTRRSMNSAAAFDLHPDLIEKHNAAGWDLNFKSSAIFGQEQTRQMQSYRENGWEEVDARQVPGFMPSTHMGPVRIEGTVLMRRPMYLSDRSHAENRREAMQQVSRHLRSIEVEGEGDGRLLKPKLTKEWSAE